jgi:hypothetical protein
MWSMRICYNKNSMTCYLLHHGNTPNVSLVFSLSTWNETRSSRSWYFFERLTRPKSKRTRIWKYWKHLELENLSFYVEHILRLFRDDEAAMASTTTKTAWDEAGIESETRDMTTYVNINERKIRDSHDFQDIWIFNYHPIEPSARGQKQ